MANHEILTPQPQNEAHDSDTTHEQNEDAKQLSNANQQAKKVKKTKKAKTQTIFDTDSENIIFAQ